MAYNTKLADRIREYLNATSNIKIEDVYYCFNIALLFK